MKSHERLARCKESNELFVVRRTEDGFTVIKDYNTKVTLNSSVFFRLYELIGD
jgi:hypothetical protein